MTTLPALAIEHSAPALPAADLEAAASFARQEKAPATRAAYRSDFAAFRVWCCRQGRRCACRPAPRPWRPISRTRPRAAWPRAPSPAAAPRSATPIASPTSNRRPIPKASGRRSAASAGRSAPHPPAKPPSWPSTARAMALSAPDGLKGLRDRALLLLGFAGAFRRSELVALDVADLEETEDGLPDHHPAEQRPTRKATAR